MCFEGVVLRILWCYRGDMKRRQMHLDDHQDEQLRRLADERGTSVAELIRRAIEMYLREEERRPQH